ncbi:MAG: pilin [Candidatus Campbellbacteria bacterium]|nr:pilin [Candidatus Campbellbacteria bacterium]
MKKILLLLTLVFAPLVSFAVTDLAGLIGLFTGLLNPILALLTGLAVLFFIWGIVKYIRNAGDEAKAQEGKSIMTYGILALFILFSFWGIVQLLYRSIF